MASVKSKLLNINKYLDTHYTEKVSIFFWNKVSILTNIIYPEYSKRTLEYQLIII